MNKFLTLNEYEDIAIKMLKKYAKRGNFHNNDEAIGYVSYYLMLADDRYDEKTGTRGGFRSAYGRCGILNWINRKSQYKKPTQRELKHSMSFFGDETSSKLDEYRYNYNETNNTVQARDIVDFIHKIPKLTKNEKRVVIMRHYENHTYKGISEEIGVSRSRVQQILEKGTKKLRTILQVNQ